MAFPHRGKWWADGDWYPSYSDWYRKYYCDSVKLTLLELAIGRRIEPVHSDAALEMLRKAVSQRNELRHQKRLGRLLSVALALSVAGNAITLVALLA